MIRYGLLSLLSAVVLLFGLSGPVSAQDLVKVRVYSDTPGTRFFVDGTTFDTDVTFNWPKGSKHILSCVPNGSAPDPNTTNLPLYISGCNGWTPSSGQAGSGLNLELQVDPAVTSYKTTASTLYRLVVKVASDVEGSPLGSVQCAAPGDVPAGQYRQGIVFVGGQCYSTMGATYVNLGTVNLAAYAFPGFVFKSWSSNLGDPLDAPQRSYEIKGPVTIGAVFEKAKRTRFVTDPVGLDVMVDSARVQTASSNPCRSDELLPFQAPVPGFSGLSSLCKGDFDFAYNSKHIIGAPSPQQTLTGDYLVFDSWDFGGGQDTVYTPSLTNGMDVLTARFVPGARVSFLTSPVPLTLQVDSDPAPKSLNFIWAYNSKHTVSAPAEQFDASGRKYAFKGWSNGGGASQTVTVDPSQLNAGGLRYVAMYELLPRAIVQTTLPAAVVKVDGADCASPCTIDRPAGSSVRLSVPSSIPVNDVTRYDFTGWQDGGPAERTVTFSQDFQAIKGNFVVSNKLTVIVDPPEAGVADVSPKSPDGFYTADTTVNVITTANDGYKFRRFEGDIQGTNHIGSVRMLSPRIVRAMFDKVPFISSAGVRNAAADIPDNLVAGGSLVSIYGVNLAKDLFIGPASPLAQSLGGTVVMLNDRPLPLIYVSPQQINAKLPDDLVPGTYTIVVKNDGLADVSGSFSTVRNAPGLFINQIKDRGYVLAFHEDGTLLTPDSPARRNEVVSVLGTGFGPYAQPVLEGFALPDSPVVPLADPVEVTVGGVKLQPTFAGGAPGFVGINAVKFRISADLPRSATVDFKATVNGRESNVLSLPLE